MSAPPVIGISCYLEPVDRAPWVGQVSAVLPHDYLRQVQAAGAVAVVLPPRLDATEPVVGAVLDRIDGLMIAGGVDLEAQRYGARPHPGAQAPRPDRDAWEIALVRGAVARDLPVLGICRGMQVMAVEAGATLEQHLPDRVGHQDHSPTPGAYARHQIVATPGTRLAVLLGVDPIEVPTYHHQAVEPGSIEGTRYLPSAWHADGTLEAMEDPAGRFRLAVQWHPEAGEDPRLFTALVGAARGTRSAD